MKIFKLLLLTIGFISLSIFAFNSLQYIELIADFSVEIIGAMELMKTMQISLFLCLLSFFTFEIIKQLEE